jgi:hypothetical protein
MFRIVKESFENFKNDFKTTEGREDYRYQIMAPFEILFDSKRFQVEKELESNDYQKVVDFLHYVQKNIDQYPEFKVLLWELKSLGIEGKKYDSLDLSTKEEILKTFQMLLNLTYWQ